MGACFQAKKLKQFRLNLSHTGPAIQFLILPPRCSAHKLVDGFLAKTSAIPTDISLALATLGNTTQIGSFLFVVLRHPRWLVAKTSIVDSSVTRCHWRYRAKLRQWKHGFIADCRGSLLQYPLLVFLVHRYQMSYCNCPFFRYSTKELYGRQKR